MDSSGQAAREEAYVETEGDNQGSSIRLVTAFLSSPIGHLQENSGLLSS